MTPKPAVTKFWRSILAPVLLVAAAIGLWPAMAQAADDCTQIGAVVADECQVSQFVTASGTLSIARPLHILGTGQIKVPPAATGQPPSSLSLNVTGTLTIDAPLLLGGGAVVGDVQDAGAIGAVLTIVASGDIALAGHPTRGASITSNANPTDCAGNGRAGKVSVTSTGGSLVAGLNTQIMANAQCPGGEITINVPSNDISIDGSVSASAGYSGLGNLTISKGGPVTIGAGCRLTLGPDSSVRSSGVTYGADRIHLESGCDTLIQGEVRSEGGIAYPGLLLNETLPNKCVEGARTNKATSFPTGYVPPAWQPTACLEIWSGAKITVLSKSAGALFAESGNAASGQNGLCCSWIDVFATSDIAVQGPALPFYALNARQYASHAPAGLVTVKSVNGKVTATGGGFITASGRADVTEGGGTVWIEAGGPTSLPPSSTTGDPASNVDLNATWVQARASVASPPATIRIRSYNGDITGTSGGLLDSRTDSGGVVTMTIQGCRLPEYFTDWNGTQILPATVAQAQVCGGTPTLAPPAALPKRPVLVTMVGGTFPWDNQPHAATGSVKDAVTGQSITTPPLTITYLDAVTGAPLSGPPVNPGVYTAVGSFAGDANYAAATGTARLEIFVGVVSVSATGNACVYSGDPCPASASATIDGAPRTPTVTYNGSTTVPVDAGTYAVVASLAGQIATATVTITPFTPTIPFSGDGTFVFDASAHRVTATVKGAKGVVLATLTYTGANTAAFGYTPSIGTLAGPFNVCVTGCVSGGYQVTASYPGSSPNYLSVTAQTAVIITKATPTVFVGDITVVFGQTYGYTSSNSYVLGVGNPPEQLGAPALVYKDATGAVLPAAPTLPGTYTVVGTYTGSNTNYVPSSGAGAVLVTGSGIVTINPAIATISLPSPVYTYTGVPQGVTATVTGEGIASGTTATVTYSGTASPATAPTNVGVYPTQATFSRTGYVANPVTGTVTINAATPTITVTGGTFTYDGTPKSATGSVTGPAIPAGTVPTITYTLNGVTTSTPPVNAGVYQVTGTFSGANYVSVSATATLTINRATATITLTGGTYLYDTLPHPAVGTVSGTALPAGTTPSIGYTLGGVATGTPVNAGIYTATGTYTNPNYTATPATATVTINARSCTAAGMGGFTFTTIAYPWPTSVATTAYGVNGAGQIVGGFNDSAPQSRGFWLSGSGGTYGAPAIEATTLGATSTTVYGINTVGQIVGKFVDATGRSRGFLLTGSVNGVGGIFTPIDYPATLDGVGTSAYGINELGEIVGVYVDGAGTSHGFTLTGITFDPLTGAPSLTNALFTQIDASTLGATQTWIYGLSNDGEVVGAYTDAGGAFHGLSVLFTTADISDLTGATFATVDFPGAANTWAHGVNDAGQIVGSYDDSTGFSHGFFLPSDNAFATVDAGQCGTQAEGINNSGQIVGGYLSPDGPRGFVTGLAATGPFTTYTQGGWGTKPKGDNPGALLAADFFAVYPGGSVVIGGTRTLTFTSASGISGFLPAKGKAASLTSSATNPTKSDAGVFAGQVLSLRLSVDFSNAGIKRFGLANLTVVKGPLVGYTVAQVLALANTVLGGNTAALPSGLTLADLNDVVDEINRNFDNGKADKHYLQ